MADVWDGGRRIVAPVSAVTDDFVRACPAPALRVVAEEGTPEEVVGRESVVGADPEEDVGRAMGLFLDVIGGREVVVEDAAALL